ncbi:HD family phosphohydrolase [Ichthyobacterium seriolicida]|uniref:Phosphohydrolase n=1 Tax=Ichthyobacterium seriolicida TaxID=242600 RepID=A0A1J1E554_9FLAO|nr:HDIG domain-containing metalloprotein [Ichthyobacterium seriolicida]BAV95188.1 phosphohydrolase [Ichthyobacterium seriolicida]
MFFPNLELKNTRKVYRISMFVFAIFFTVYIFPKKNNFQYEYQKGKPWMNKTLYSKFDFPIIKSEKEIEAEENIIKNNSKLYFIKNDEIVPNILENISKRLSLLDVIPYRDIIEKNNLSHRVLRHLKEIYNKGLVKSGVNIKSADQVVSIVEDNVYRDIIFEEMYQKDDAIDHIIQKLEIENSALYLPVKKILIELIVENVSFSKDKTDKFLERELQNIIYTKGLVYENTKIIAKGDIVTSEKMELLDSLKKGYENRLEGNVDIVSITIGFIVLVSVLFVSLYIFLKNFNPNVLKSNKHLSLLITIILFILFITCTIINIDSSYLYVIPFCSLPLVLRTFFDNKLALFVHIITILMIGIVVSNGFEFMFIQIVAGVITVLYVGNIVKRANLFICVSRITITYIVTYIAFTVIQSGSLTDINMSNMLNIMMFLFSGLLTLFAHPLIYMCEKIFGITSYISILELSDTNSRVLKKLANKAPGTFQHSLQVANIAEAAAMEIGADYSLVRVGALYHDIGKMFNPLYFIENQRTGSNLHDKLSPKESASIIIDHVTKGISIAKENKLPNKVIDFISTHHGTSTVKYFYKLELDSNEKVNKEDFKYKGPKPFSKETSILMIVDSIEAASRSINNPTIDDIDALVEKIVEDQIEEKQFKDSEITFKDITKIKEVVKSKLTDIYHLRVEYPS